jgi:hypothetical protein
MATRIPRMAAKNPSERTPHTMHRTVLANGLDRVLAACRCKTAPRPNQWTDTNLIKTNQLDHAGRKESLDHSIRTDTETSSLVDESAKIQPTQFYSDLGVGTNRNPRPTNSRSPTRVFDRLLKIGTQVCE